jgi:hypothetical protein
VNKENTQASQVAIDLRKRYKGLVPMFPAACPVRAHEGLPALASNPQTEGGGGSFNPSKEHLTLMSFISAIKSHAPHASHGGKFA